MMLIIIILLAMILPKYQERIKRAMFKKTMIELSAIAEASANYLETLGSCPNLQALVPNFIPQNVDLNPFGNLYEINCGDNLITVNTLIPQGLSVGESSQGGFISIKQLGLQDQISVSRTIHNAFISRMEFCRYDLCS